MAKPRGSMPDQLLFVAVLALLGIGIVMVASASSIASMRQLGDALHYLKRQSLWALIGIIVMLTVMRIDYRKYMKFALPGVLVSIALLVIVLLIGASIGGSRRWIDLGFFNLQPSELTKLAIVNFIATYVAYRRDKIKSFWYGFLPPIVIVGVCVGLIALEPDFGTAAFTFALTLVLLFAGGADITHMAYLILGILPAAVMFVIKEPYRLARIMAFINPWADAGDTGWNIIQSLLAIGSGGLFGLGLGMSRQKFLYLPERHTDFVFAILAEELGFIGGVVVLICFFIFAWRGYRIALKAPDLFGTLLAVGVTSQIVFQAIMNIGVVSGSLPVTGIPLPFLSYGGTTLVITMAGVGVLLNISRHSSID